MKRQDVLKIALALNAIALLSDSQTFEQIKEHLKTIEEVVKNEEVEDD